MSKQTENKGGSKVATFLKKNIYYILMVVAVLAIVAMIVVAAVAGQQDTPIDGPNNDDPVINKPDDDKPTVDDKPEFKFVIEVPVATETIGLDYSEDELVFHPTQGAWKTHLGIDYMASAGTEVKAVFDGKIKSIDTDGYNGTVMVITHEGGFESTYKLLAKETSKKVGDSVKKGDVIGTIGNDSTFEVKQGEHIHYELRKDGKFVDPNLYMAKGDK